MPIIQFDYESIKNRIKNNLSSKSEWSGFLDYGVADNLISPIAQELAYAMNYNEYLTYENFWQKARNKSSLLVQSTVHGYSVPRKKGAIGTLRVSTDSKFSSNNPTGNNVVIPKFFQFSGNDIYVVADDNYILPYNSNYVDIQCKQGEYKSVKFLAQGNLYEEKLIVDDSVDNDFFELFVNGVPWKNVDTLFEYGATDLVYEIITQPDLSGVLLRFGNNIFGKKLEINDQVEFKYISTLGNNGNIFTYGIIKNVESQAFDILGKPVKLYVDNISTIIGGKDYPSLDEIRSLSPKVYQTGDRASSVDDYTTKIKQFSYISKVNVWGAYETLLDEKKPLWTFIPSEENVVHLALLDSVYENLSDAQKTQVIEDLHKKNDPTDLIQFETVEKIPMIFYIDAIASNSSYPLEQIRASIESVLINNYSIENTDFNKNIYNSDFVRLIDEVNGVRNHNSYIKLLKEGQILTENYAGQFQLPIYPIDSLTVNFYIKDITEEEDYILFAYCDEEGNIIGLNNYDTFGSKLNLTNGLGVLIFREGLTKDFNNYSIKIEYKSLNQDLILNKRSNIFTYNSSIIKVEYPSI